ncbi:MAG: hypothetical protein ACFCUP_05480 [Actinomycetales bacterium]
MPVDSARSVFELLEPLLPQPPGSVQPLGGQLVSISKDRAAPLGEERNDARSAVSRAAIRALTTRGGVLRLTMREHGRAGNEAPSWGHLDSGLDREWLCADRRDAMDELETDCPGSPCLRCEGSPTSGADVREGPPGCTSPPPSGSRPAALPVG